MARDPIPRLPDIATSALGHRVRLALLISYDARVMLPAVTGRLARALPGYFGLLRYLVELDRRLPAGFEPFAGLPWFARARPITSLLVAPAPDVPTLETPPDYLGEGVMGERVVHVFVSVVPTSRELRLGADAASEARCPFLCMADLVGIADPPCVRPPHA